MEKKVKTMDPGTLKDARKLPEPKIFVLTRGAHFIALYLVTAGLERQAGSGVEPRAIGYLIEIANR